jgi:hypothetical protein
MMTHPAPDVGALVAPAWAGTFASTDLVTAAAGMFTGAPVDRRELGATVVRGATNTLAMERRLFPHRFEGLPADCRRAPRVGRGVDWESGEGPRWRVLVSPGSVSVRYSDPVRADRRHERDVAARSTSERLQMLVDLDDAGARGRCVTSWSAKSRSRMVETINQLDWADVLGQGRPPAMVTLTYPGDWLAVAPEAAAASQHVRLLQLRYKRAWGHKLVAVWKREFQERGAPHYHLLMVPPAGTVNGQSFRVWLASTWAGIVNAERCAGGCSDVGGCCEYRRHLAAGVRIDIAKGAQATDPTKIGVYFSKHGAYGAKEYQNQAPAEWIAGGGSVGRFWGYWGLSPVVAGAMIEPADAIAIGRTMRRYSRANAPLVRVPVWRYRTVVDPETGEISAKWRRATKRRRLYRVKNSKSGFLATKDGPGLASALARHVDQLHRPDDDRRTGRPVGFLP